MTSRIHAGGQAQRAARRALVDQARAQGYPLMCARCGDWIDERLSGLNPLGLTVGHVLPVSLGGSDAPGNLRPEHRACNLAAGGRPTPPRAVIARPIEVD